MRAPSRALKIEAKGMPQTTTLPAPAAGPLEGVTATINAEAVERLSAGEPDWLAGRRWRAWEIYQRTPLPTTRLEEWRYTDLSRRLALDSLRPAASKARGIPARAYPPAVRQAMREDWDATGHIVEIDGRVVHADLVPELARQGVVLASLRDAVSTHEDLLREHLATESIPPEQGKFSALNAALWTDGAVLFVPRDVSLPLPVRVTRWVSDPAAAYFTRTLIVGGAGSKVSFVEEVLSPDFDEQTLFLSAAEVLGGDNSTIQYASLQRMGMGAFHMALHRSLVGRDAGTDSLHVTLGATTSRLDLNAELGEPGGRSHILGLYFGNEDQHFDHNTSQNHAAPYATSDLLYKGALDDASGSVFRGIIRVSPGAQRTDAYQTNRNLLLSEEASAHSLPNLEIEADDVRCSHGATVGQLDEEALFYLQSRGLSRRRAERLVVRGFLQDVLQRRPPGGVTEKVTRAIEEKLRG
jgi:Fe-S cluster assembly protein SufD